VALDEVTCGARGVGRRLTGMPTNIKNSKQK